MPAIDFKDGFIYLKIKVKANSKKTEIKEITMDEISINVAAVPDKEKTNFELISFISCFFKIPRKEIILVSGHHNCHKTIKFKANLEIENQFKNIINQISSQ